jgi:hypothetical protein
LQINHGVPNGVCTEIAPGVFRREWSQAKIELDWYSLAAEITRKQKEGENQKFAVAL